MLFCMDQRQLTAPLEAASLVPRCRSTQTAGQSLLHLLVGPFHCSTGEGGECKAVIPKRLL